MFWKKNKDKDNTSGDNDIEQSNRESENNENNKTGFFDRLLKNGSDSEFVYYDE